MKAFFISFIIILFSEIVLSQQVRFGLDPGFAISRGDYQPDEGIDRRVLEDLMVVRFLKLALALN